MRATPSVGQHDAALRRDAAVDLGAAVPVEVEQRVLVLRAPVEVAAGHDHFVVGGQRLGDDLAAGRDDHRLAQRVDAFLDAALGHTDHPRAVLVGAALHHERVVEALQDVLAGVGHVVDGRVVTDQHQLHALQTHHAVRLGPAPVVADGHADDAAERPPHAEAVRAGLEVVALGVLERPIGLVVLVAGDVRLLVGGDDAAVALDQRLHVPADGPSALVEVGVAEAEADAQPLRFVEQRLRGRVGHLALVPVVGLADVVDEPSGEERGERQLRVHHQLGTHARGPRAASRSVARRPAHGCVPSAPAPSGRQRRRGGGALTKC